MNPTGIEQPFNPVFSQVTMKFRLVGNRPDGRQVGVSATWADYGDAAIDNGGVRPGSELPWKVRGSYSSNRILFIGLNYGW